MTAPACLLYSTFPDAATAQAVAHALVESHLAACCNILPNIASVYWWEGAVQTGTELAMLVKTTTDCAPAAMEKIAALHPYENPAILQFSVDGGAPEYLQWVAASVKPVNTAT